MLLFVNAMVIRLSSKVPAGKVSVQGLKYSWLGEHAEQSDWIIIGCPQERRYDKVSASWNVLTQQQFFH